MDSTKLELILSELHKISEKIENLSVGKSWIEVYSPIFIGLFAVLVSLYIGFKQVRASTISKIKIENFNKIQTLMRELNQNIVDAILLIEQGNTINSLNNIFIRLDRIEYDFELLLDKNSTLQKDFMVKIKNVIQHFKTTTSKLNYQELSKFWNNKKDELLPSLDEILAEEIKNII